MKLIIHFRFPGILLPLMFLSFLPMKTGFAQSSTHYQLQKSVLDISGMASESSHYFLVDAIGQPSPVGEIFSTNYILSGGFLGQAIDIEFRSVKLTAIDGDSGDAFGRSLALLDEYALVGASDDDNTKGRDAGAVYVFQQSGDNWIEQTKILAADGADADIFGYALAADGHYMIVGAPWDDDNGHESGSAYIFHFDGTSWTQQAKLVASDAGEDNRFGISVDIHREYALIGAFFDNDFGSRSGSAYIFKRNGDTWSEQAILKADDGAEDDWFGVSVSIYGDQAAVGARYDDNENGENAGAVYIFSQSGDLWTQNQKLTARDGAGDDLFHEVQLSGDHLLVGAYQDDDKGENSGSIYFFKYNGVIWSEQQKLTARDGAWGENFGSSIAISGERMAAGAYRDDDNGANSGSIYLFNYDGIQWNEETKIIAFDGDAGDFYGLPVAISGDHILAAARNDDDKGVNAGAAYSYGVKTTSVPLHFPKTVNATLFQLLPAYPNPFNPGTTIRYILPKAAQVDIAIYNTLGQRIRSLRNGFQSQGAYSVYWDARDDTGISLSSGVYFCQIQAGAYRHSIKLAILK